MNQLFKNRRLLLISMFSGLAVLLPSLSTSGAIAAPVQPARNPSAATLVDSQPQGIKKQKKKKIRKVVEEDESVDDRADNRSRNHFKNGYGGMFGMLQMGNGGGLEFSMPTGPKFRLMLQLSMASDNLVAKGGEAKDLHLTTKFSQTQIALKGKYFFSETFFGTAGFGYSILDGKYGVTQYDKEILWDGSGSRTDLTVGIGNEWVWPSGVFIAAEWIGYSHVLSAQLTRSSSGTDSQIAVDQTIASNNLPSVIDTALGAVVESNIYALLISCGKRI